jgi:hypothetical protein
MKWALVYNGMHEKDIHHVNHERQKGLRISVSVVVLSGEPNRAAIVGLLFNRHKLLQYLLIHANQLELLRDESIRQ